MTGSPADSTPSCSDMAAREIDALWRDLSALAAHLRKVREDLAAIGVTTIRESHLAPATDQLGAVVETTEVAATRILDACDALAAVAREVGGEVGRRIIDALTTINEACGFHDLTGQRILRVMRSLGQVEQKITRLAEVFGIGDFVASAREASADAEPGGADEASLMNGPQLPARAIDQAEIDRLLAEFD